MRRLERVAFPSVVWGARRITIARAALRRSRRHRWALGHTGSRLTCLPSSPRLKEGVPAEETIPISSIRDRRPRLAISGQGKERFWQERLRRTLPAEWNSSLFLLDLCGSMPSSDWAHQPREPTSSRRYELTSLPRADYGEVLSWRRQRVVPTKAVSSVHSDRLAVEG